jgi:DNA (cytosine-5)-methyltransferase 1
MGAAYYNEIDPNAAAWLRELIKQGHIADGVVDERSIVDVRPDELREFTQCHFFAGIGAWSYALRSAGWADDRPVWTGSCPCQPFSAAGARGGFDDQRHLWPHWHHLISQCRPPVVFGEQVASKDGLGWLDLVHADMEATGYAVGAADLCAAGVGAPHIRQRLWFVGLADAASGGCQSGPGVAGVSAGQVRHVTVSSGGIDGSNDRLADAEVAGQQAWGGYRIRNAGAVESASAAAHGGGADGLADADGDRRNESLQSVSGGLPERIGGGGFNNWVGNTDDQGSQEHGRSGDIHLRKPNGEDQGRQHIDAGMDVRASQQPSPTNGFWREADWLFCRDGKWRPVEPSTFPLADGSPARVGRLRGYGNAIAAPVAQTFIESVMDIL